MQSLCARLPPSPSGPLDFEGMWHRHASFSMVRLRSCAFGHQPVLNIRVSRSARIAGSRQGSVKSNNLKEAKQAKPARECHCTLATVTPGNLAMRLSSSRRQNVRQHLIFLWKCTLPAH